jgi:hypothetical protein
MREFTFRSGKDQRYKVKAETLKKAKHEAAKHFKSNDFSCVDVWPKPPRPKKQDDDYYQDYVDSQL